MKNKENMTLSELILGFASASLFYLGEVDENGEQRETPGEVDVGMARHNLSILELIQEKTSGNRDEGESELLHNVIADLSRKLS